jgi:branched-chain amino acid transport system permease protein
MSGISRQLATYLAVGLVLGGVALSGNAFLIQAAIGIAISAILALSWDILSRTGQVSLGQSAFFGIGAYGSGLLTPHLGSVLGWLAAMLLCAGTAILVGLVTLRLRRLYFTIATMSFGLSMQVLILVTPGITGGSTGIMPPVLMGGVPAAQLALITAFLIVAAIVSDVLLGRRFRPAFFMIRSNPALAASSGVPVVAAKVATFAVSGMLAGIAGACYAGLYGYVIPEDVFTPNWSVLPLAVSILGGMDTTLGPILGALVLRVLEEAARHVVGGTGYQVVYGAVIIVFILVLPKGLAGALPQLRRKLAALPPGTPEAGRAA